MNYQEITQEECSEALAKIITVLSEIILDPHENKTSVYPKVAEAFNSIADEVGFNGPRFGDVTFNSDLGKTERQAGDDSRKLVLSKIRTAVSKPKVGKSIESGCYFRGTSHFPVLGKVETKKGGPGPVPKIP